MNVVEKIFCGCCIVLLCFLASCSKRQNGVETIDSVSQQVDTEALNATDDSDLANQEELLDMLHKIVPTKDSVKMLGRTYLYEDTLWCAFSGTGIEYEFQGKTCYITVVADDMVLKSEDTIHRPRIAVFVDDERVVDEVLQSRMQIIKVCDYSEERTVTIRVVKLSESSDSTVGIQSIHTDTTSIVPTDEQKLHIEFIGDSITCGYGVDGTLDDTYATSNEDVTKGYAYLCAKDWEAEYSIVALSGHGILSGYTDDGTIQEEQILPPYYTTLGRSYGKFASSVDPSSIAWDFSSFVPDIIVINLGTNDASYCGNDPTRSLAFQERYVNFLKVVRANNPSSTIVCTLGIMGDSLFPYIEDAVTAYQSDSGDKNIETMRLTEQKSKDGYGVDYHPSAATHKKAAYELRKDLNLMKMRRDREAREFSYPDIDTQWIDPTKKLVAFAFDDGPVSWSEDSSAMKILKTLESYGQHATFFYVGQQIDALNQAEIMYAKKIGCEIANHTWTHPFLTQLSAEEIQEEVEKTRKKLYEITGIDRFLVRVPYLNYDDQVLQAVNVPCISMGVDSADWNDGTYDSVMERMITAADNGSLENAIVLMHETYGFTADAVVDLVPYLLEHGYQIVSISELASIRGEVLEAGKIYTRIP